ncbi:death-on-curing family protein [Calothrix sp. NIES-4071]|nr:death-on-curing family protein [Calothrix sp. NIES-4071]BAZ61532.1 death-on-curing family protein [Calothrix sp. NIES-4105]
MNFPDKSDVIAVHAQLIAVTGGSQGLRDEGALESALAAPLNRLYYSLCKFNYLCSDLCFPPYSSSCIHWWK